MSIRQIIKCSVCGKEQTEEKAGDGFIGWGALQGVSLNGEENPTICPAHLGVLAEYLDKMGEL